jgi:hypothetical protein
MAPYQSGPVMSGLLYILINCAKWMLVAKWQSGLQDWSSLQQVSSDQTKARTFYVGPEEPLNLASFDETFTGKAGELLPTLFDAGINPGVRLTVT